MYKIQGNIKTKANVEAVASQLEQAIGKTGGTGDVAITVMNTLKELSGLTNLRHLSQDHVSSYISHLQERVAEGSLARKTTATYVTGLNNIIRHTNKYIDKNTVTLEPQLAKDHGLSAGPKGDVLPSASNEVHSQIRSYFVEKNDQKPDIKNEAMPHIVDIAKYLGLRIEECIMFAYLTPEQIRETIKTGVLPIEKGTKNNRPRNIKLSDVETTRTSQINTIKNACGYMSKHELSNMCPTKLRQTMYDFVYNAKRAFEKATGLKYNFHDERRTYAQQSFKEYKTRLTEHQATMNVSQNLGHNRPDVLGNYIPK